MYKWLILLTFISNVNAVECTGNSDVYAHEYFSNSKEEWFVRRQRMDECLRRIQMQQREQSLELQLLRERNRLIENQIKLKQLNQY